MSKPKKHADGRVPSGRELRECNSLDGRSWGREIQEADAADATPDAVLRAVKANRFTGAIIGPSGHKRHYVNGKEVV